MEYDMTSTTTDPTKQHTPKCPKLYGQECTCDSYHTFDELYKHRIALFCILGRFIDWDEYNSEVLWKSKLHHDGTAYEGWFIAGIGTMKGEQISYHIPMKYWKKFGAFHTRRKAPEWDGHTPDDVVKRLFELI